MSSLRKLVFAASVGALACLVAGQARAGSVTVAIDPGAGAAFAQQAGISLAQLQTQLQTEISNLFQTADTHDYLRKFGDAQAFTTKGLGVDYASNVSLFEIGIAGSSAINVNDSYKPNSRETPPVEGAGFNATIMGGVNLGFMGLAPVTLFGNYFQQSGTFQQLSGDLHTWGAHAHVRLFGPEGNSRRRFALPLEWGGIGITSGVDYSRLQLNLGSGQVSTDIALDGTMGATASWSGAGTYTLDLRTYTVPLEVTTSLRLLYILTVYGGGGFDWQLGGGNDMVLDLQGKLSGKFPNQGTVDIGTVHVTAQDSTPGAVGHLRGIVGVQANIAFLRIFTQLNWMADKNIAGIAFGLRLAF